MSSSITVLVGGEVLDPTSLGENEVGLSSLVGAALGAGRPSGNKGRFRSPEELQESDGLRETWIGWRNQIREAINTRGTAIGKVLEERQWQFDAAISVICGFDTSVITATSDGKSFAYQILSIVKPESIILCVSPLVSLQEDQVQGCRHLGIKACALNAKNLETDPEILIRASRAEYQVVFVTPEFISPENANFVRLLGLKNKSYTAFKLRCKALVIDESHLVFHWRKFRKQYVTLGIIRSFLSGIPILTLSATAPPHVRKRVNYTLGMARPTTLIERSVDRPNIYLSVEYVRSTLTSFLDLNYLIPKAHKCESPTDIPKTIIFVDNRRSVWSLTTYLLQLMEDEFGAGEFSDLVADYSTVLSQDHRNTVLDDFAAGYIRILVCTEAAGMGVDIPDIRRVIQWGVPNFINLSTLWQRMGRAGRSQDTQAVFTLWLQRSMSIKPAGDNLAIYRSPIKENDNTTRAIMSSIIDYEEKVDQLAARFGSNVLQDFNDEEALTLLDNVGDGSDDMDNNERDHQLTLLSASKNPKDTRLRFDRGILALGSNSGCYRALFLRYFNSAPQPLLSQEHCCANCARDQIPESILELLSPDTFDPKDPAPNMDTSDPDLADPDDNAQEELNDEYDEPLQGASSREPRKRTPYYVALAALSQLHAFRIRISIQHFGVTAISPDLFLSFEEIRKISKCICSITQPQDFCRYLKIGEHYHLAPIAPYVSELLSLCQHIATNTPRPPRRRTEPAPPIMQRQASTAPSSRPQIPENISTSQQHSMVPEVNTTNTSVIPPPPKAALPRAYDPKKYDPKKRREYYLKAKARKQQEAQALLPNITNTVSGNPKRQLHPQEDQENIPPSKVARTY